MGLAIWAEQQELHTQFLLKPARKAYCPNICTVRNMSADLTNKPNLAIYYVVKYIYINNGAKTFMKLHPKYLSRLFQLPYMCNHTLDSGINIGP